MNQTDTAALEADFTNAVKMNVRALRLKSRATKAGDYGNAAIHLDAASKWWWAAWSIAGKIDRFRVNALVTAATAAARAERLD
jgi:hypothetical protein